LAYALAITVLCTNLKPDGPAIKVFFGAERPEAVAERSGFVMATNLLKAVGSEAWRIPIAIGSKNCDKKMTFIVHVSGLPV